MEFCGMKREIDRKCLNHARVHANAQSFDRCEVGEWVFWSAHDIMTSVTGSDISLPWQRAKIRLWALKEARKGF